MTSHGIRSISPCLLFQAKGESWKIQGQYWQNLKAVSNDLYINHFLNDCSTAITGKVAAHGKGCSTYYLQLLSPKFEAFCEPEQLS